jgi:hypothetical protein
VWLAVLVVSVAALPARANVTVDTTGVTYSPPTPVIVPNGVSIVSGGFLTFNFTKGPGILALEAGTPSEQALADEVVNGFMSAGDLWSMWFSDSVTINVGIDYGSLPLGVLGSTTNVTEQSDFGPTRTALIADATTATDAVVTAHLQPGAALDMITNDTSVIPSPRIRDNDGSANNYALDVPRGNLKALGVIAPHDPGPDGAITFSDSFWWDFDRSNGISVGKFDFVGVAAHEIGHLMGYISGVDIVDLVGGSGPSAPIGIDPYRVFSVLDMLRYSSESLDADLQPATGAVLDLAYGDTPFFSIDAGDTNLGRFATGAFNGDGRQASHWKDHLGLGMLDPTVAPGELMLISDLDLQAFDAIGYDLVPEPATVSLLVMGGAMLALRRRRSYCP